MKPRSSQGRWAEVERGSTEGFVIKDTALQALPEFLGGWCGQLDIVGA